MRPENLNTKIFLDSGDPSETRRMISLVGFLDGQTTNPSLIAKNPNAVARLARGEKFSKQEVLDFYKGVVMEISSLIPHGSVSVEVYADLRTTTEEMLDQARELYAWIPNAHIKFPTNAAGLAAAHAATTEGMRVNMTLVFTQEQAAAVHAATLGAKKGDVFLSPFVGRLDDRGENGMDLIKNSVQMYRAIQSHVEVLTASVRSLDHFLYALALGSDCITAPASVLEQWVEKDMPIPPATYPYDDHGLTPIPNSSLDLIKPWSEYRIDDELLTKGIERFANDWNALIDSSR